MLSSSPDLLVLVGRFEKTIPRECKAENILVKTFALDEQIVSLLIFMRPTYADLTRIHKFHKWYLDKHCYKPQRR